MLPRLSGPRVPAIILLALLASSGQASGEARDASREALAYRLLASGYSARETTDIVAGRITRHALDTARRLIAAGHGREVAADYLDRQYRSLAAAVPSRRAPDAPVVASPGASIAALITHYAARHGVDATVVRAVAEVESSFDAAARSPAGATGVMQLMPATARELGVNPLVTAENIEGGVRYLAEQLRTFGRLDLALVAYNAGPGYARRYAAGQAALYGETRQYVARVLGRLREAR